MDFFQIVILIGVGVLVVLHLKPKRVVTDSSLEKELQKEQAEKAELQGKGKQLFMEHTELKAEYKALAKESDRLRSDLEKFEARKERHEKEHDEQLNKLDEAKTSLADERARVRRDDEERQQAEIEARDRLWAEHEQVVVAKMKEICKLPDLGFTCYDNTNLPAGFDGSLKPDVLIEFLGQYVIFDAKVSRSDNFQNYINTQVVSTAKKVKGNTDIYTTIFLVVPTDAIKELKATAYYEQNFQFYVISPDALGPILASLKKISSYEFTDSFDPQERENLVDLISSMASQLDFRSTMDVAFAEQGVNFIKDQEAQYPEIAKEVSQQKQKIKTPSIKPSEIKRLMSSVDAREDQIAELKSPTPKISKKKVEEAKQALESNIQ